MLLPLIASLLALGGQATQECSFEDTRSAQLTGAQSLLVNANAGELRIEGRAGVDDVQIEAHLCASSRELLSEMQLVTGVEGGRAEIRTGMPDHDFNGYARMDLVIVVPRGMPAGIDDGSGPIDLSGLGDTRVTDGSGDVDLREMVGSVDIEDGSGSITAENVAGDFTIDDGSGDLSLRTIEGIVTIDDSSGGIDIVDARRNVRIDDSSGSIDVRGVGGDFTVDDDGSGGIRYSDVAGTVDVPERKRR